MGKKLLLTILAMGFMGSATIVAADAPTKKAKQTPQGLYLTAKEAHDMVKKDPSKVLFVDVRTPAELYFVGYPDMIDINIPTSYIDYTKFKEKKNKVKFASHKNEKILQQLEAALKAKKLTKDSDIILICRSGSRTGRLATILNDSGYKKVYTVIDGFEGDKDKNHKRTVNGWKNAGLPWGYKIVKEKFILER